MLARGDGYSIIKRKRNGKELSNFEVRIQVPKSWQARVGRKERLVSLHTGDRRAATLLAPDIVARQIAEWRELVDAPFRGAPTDPASVAVRVAFDGMLSALENSRKAWPADDTEYATRLAARHGDRRRLTRRLHDGELGQWEAMADRMIVEHGLSLEKGTSDYNDYVRDLATMTIDAVDTFLRRAEGELDATPRTAIVRDEKERAAAKAKSGESIMELFEKLAGEALELDLLRPDTVNQNRKVLQMFAEFVGVDRAIDSITPLEVCEFRDARRDVPPKWSMKRDFRGLTLRQAAEKARSLTLPKTSYVTVNRELSTISPLFTWLAEMPRWAGLANPCAGLFKKDVKGKKPRPPFETEALNRLLVSPLFTGFRADGEEHLQGEVHADDWRRWIPLTAMFTGARAGEIAQLRVCDVCKERGKWFIHMKEDAKAGLHVKNRKSRAVPVHNKLEAMGFIAFAERRREGAGSEEAALFPDLIKNERDQVGAVPSEWFRDYLVAIGLKDHRVQGGDGFGLHSFRHTLADRLRSEAELLDHEAAIFFGHDQSSTTAGYGRIPQGTVKKLSGWLDAVTWEGVDFTPLIPDETIARRA